MGWHPKGRPAVIVVVVVVGVVVVVVDHQKDLRYKERMQMSFGQELGPLRRDYHQKDWHCCELVGAVVVVVSELRTRRGRCC